MNDENLRVAILGAGPVGLEAALYARYLGYPTQLIEKHETCAAGVLALGDQSVGEFGMLASRLGVSALRAQDADWEQPAAGAALTAAEWRVKYLAPLAESDLIGDVLHLQHEVVGVTRRDTDKDASFEIHVRKADDAEATHEADVVIDATGANSSAWFGENAVEEELGFTNPEADFYVLGTKGGATSFVAGLVQIRDLFAILGEREDLDVYATMPALQ